MDACMGWEGMLAACDGVVRVVETRLPGDVCGLYSESRLLVLVDSGMADWQKRCALVHELVHWEHGDTSCSWMQRSRVEARARREAARLLIPVEDYARAERECGANAWLLACRLQVTVQVLEDFRLFLHDMGLPSASVR